MTLGGYAGLVAPSQRSKRSKTARAYNLHHVMHKDSAPRQTTMYVVNALPSPVAPIAQPKRVQPIHEAMQVQKTSFALGRTPDPQVITKVFRELLPALSWEDRTVVLSPPRPQPTSADAQPLTAAERDFLHEQGGVPRTATGAAPERPQPQRVTVLGTPEVAERLHVSDTTVNRRAHTNRLLAYPIRGRLVFPRWQFTSDGEPVAGLEVALSALPRDWGPYRIERFFTTPDEHLDDLTPIEWLRHGKAGSLVAQVLEGEARA